MKALSKRALPIAFRERVPVSERRGSDALPSPRTTPRDGRPERDEGFFGQWLVACTAGELLGFGVVAAWAWLALWLFGDSTTRTGMLAVMVMAGLCEGALLASFQWWVLRGLFPKLSARGWLAATMTVSALAWLVGMLPALTPGLADSGYDAPATVLLLLAVAFGAITGAAFGFAQWLVLRKHVAGAHHWIGANALGWAAGMPLSLLGNVVVVRSGVLFAVTGAIAGACMGLSVAVFTGLALLHIRSARGTRTGPGRDRQVGSPS